MRIVLGLIAVAAAAFVLQGLGAAMRRLIRAPRGRWSVSIGIGLAALVCAGGVLNLAHLAYRPVIWLFIAAAVAVSILQTRREKFSFAALPRDRAARTELILAGLIVFAALLFAVVTQLPPREFNYQDDLQKYFAHPVRMLETGTFRGSPLNALGSETLGGQAFLHGIVLSVAPIPYINGVDAVFGLFTLLLLASAAAWRRFGWFPGAAMPALLVAVVNPLYANVSGLYTAAALMATAVLLVADEREEPSPVLLGMIYAALVAIKPTFGLFAALHFIFFTLAINIHLRHSGKSIATIQSAPGKIGWCLRVAAWSCVCLAPWVIMYLPTYLSHGVFLAEASPVPADSAGVTLFSLYTAFAGLAVFVAILSLIASRSKNPEVEGSARPSGIFAGAAAGVACFLFLILYLSRWGGYQFCLRYSVPFLLGSCLISALMAPSFFAKVPRVVCAVIPALTCLALAASFAPLTLALDRRAVRYGSIFYYAPLIMQSDYEPYIQYSLSAPAHDEIQKYQSQVPPGEPLFAWIDTPYWLDFHRNPVTDADTAGTGTPWAHVPANVRYFLWQYSGYAVRKEGDYEERMHSPGIGARERMIAARSLALANVLSGLASHADVIASDNQFVLFKISSENTN